MTTSEEEIQARIIASKERYSKLRIAREITKKDQKEASNWLKTKKVELFYFDIEFTNDLPYINNTTVTVGYQIITTDKKDIKLKIAYAILSLNDQFSKPAARLLIANRLQDINENCKYQFTTVVPRKIAKIHAKLRQVIELKIRLEILTQPDIMPRWLIISIEKELKLHGYWTW